MQHCNVGTAWYHHRGQDLWFVILDLNRCSSCPEPAVIRQRVLAIMVNSRKEVKRRDNTELEVTRLLSNGVKGDKPGLDLRNKHQQAPDITTLMFLLSMHYIMYYSIIQLGPEVLGQ